MKEVTPCHFMIKKWVQNAYLKLWKKWNGDKKMGYRPIISKIRVFHPNKKGARRSNYNYLYYIATREGTDLTNIKSLKDFLFLDEHQVADLSVDLNEKGEEHFHDMAGDDVYLKYIANRPNSHGLFGNIPTEDFSEVSKRLDEVSDSGRVVYRDIISLSEVDAKALGFYDKRKWDIFLKNVMPDAARVLGLSQNDFTWVAAYHAEQTHPHVHVMLWGNRDKVKSPFIHPSDQEKIRRIYEQAIFTEDNEKIIRRFMQAERDEYYSLKNASRNAVTNFFKDIFRNKILVPGEDSEMLPGKLPKEIHEQIVDKYKEVIASLPDKGRMAYKYMPEECKKHIDDLSSLFFKQNDVAREYHSYMLAEENIQKMSGKTNREIKWKLEAAKKDLYKRTGNIILKGISQMQEEILEEKNDDGIVSFNDIEEKDLEIGNADHNARPEITIEDSQIEELPDDQNLPEDEINKYDSDKGDIERNTGYFDWDAKKQAMELYYNKQADETLIQEGINQLTSEAQKGNILCMEQLAHILKYQSELCENKEEQERLFTDSETYQKKSVEALSGLIETLEKEGLSEKNSKYMHSYANYRIGYHYLKGQGINQDVLTAEKYLAASSQKYSYYWLGKIYSSTENKEIGLWDMEKAIAQYIKAANAGHDYSAYALGSIFNKKNSEYFDFKKAVEYYNQASEGGVLLADIALAKIYADKSSELYDPNSAVSKLEYVINELKKQKNMDSVSKGIEESAKVNLAKIYINKDAGMCDYKKALQILDGIEDERGMAYYYKGNIYSDETENYYDMKKAVDCFEASAGKGNSSAMYKLGKIYSSPENEEIGLWDMEKAIAQYIKAANAGHGYSAYALGSIFNKKNSEYFDFKKAVEYYNQASGGGVLLADIALAKIYADKSSELYDPNSVVSKLEYVINELKKQKNMDSVSKGIEESAKVNLAKIYINKDAGMCDYKKALQILDGIEDERGMAYYYKGNIYSDETENYYDMKKAVNCFEASAGKGNSSAMYKLGKIYLYGIGVKRDKELAKFWLEKSALSGNESAIESLKNMDNINYSKYSYAMLRQILNGIHMSNSRNKQRLNEREFAAKSKQQKREEYLHHK